MRRSPQISATSSATSGGISASSACSRHGVPAIVGFGPIGCVAALTQRCLSWCRSCNSRQLRLLCADHVLAEYFFGRVGRWHYHREFAAIHHRDAIGEREDFVELGADEQNRLSLRARI